MAPLTSSPLLIEEPIRLASILEHTHSARPHVCLTKIIGTVGGNSKSTEVLVSLLEAGMTAARFDHSSGDIEEHLETLANLKVAMATANKLCAVIYDTAGPEVTIANSSGQPVELKEGVLVTLHSPGEAPAEPAVPANASSAHMTLSVPGLAAAVRPGTEIFVGQYLFTGSESTSVWLKVIEVKGHDIICETRNSATLMGNFFTVHVAQVHVPLPTLPESDKEKLTAWIRRGGTCDIVSLSFTRTAADIIEVRQLLKSLQASHTHVFAKIENLEGLSNFDDILRESDGIILGRGDLGIDLAPEKVFLFQKEAIQRCNLAGKPVIISRVVDTMTETPRPTRAEATDVANAVLDGVDCIMLGAETLRGLYPVETIATVGRICGEAEKVFNQPDYYKQIMDTVPEPMSELEAICSSAVTAAENVHAACIIVYTTTGKTARLVAKYKPTMPALCMVVPHLTTNQLIWTFTGDIQARQALVVRGLIPMLSASPTVGGSASDSQIRSALAMGITLGVLRPRDRAVVVQKVKDSWIVRVVDAC